MKDDGQYLGKSVLGHTHLYERLCTAVLVKDLLLLAKQIALANSTKTVVLDDVVTDIYGRLSHFTQGKDIRTP